MQSLAEENEEKNRMIGKFFDYAETPVQEWIAEFLNRNVFDVFTDFSDESDMIGYSVGGKHYNAYLVSLSSEEGSYVDKDLIENCVETRKACSILFDAVKTVIHPIIGTAAPEFADKLKGIYFNFDNDAMAFALTIINIPKYRKTVAIEKRKELFVIRDNTVNKLANDKDTMLSLYCNEDIKTFDDFEICDGCNACPERGECNICRDLRAIHKLEDELMKIDGLIEKTNILDTQISDEDIELEDRRCADIMETLPTKNRLHIVVEERIPDSELSMDMLELGIKRLPAFGNNYEDPDEETFSQKIKKELNSE